MHRLYHHLSRGSNVDRSVWRDRDTVLYAVPRGVLQAPRGWLRLYTLYGDLSGGGDLDDGL